MATWTFEGTSTASLQAIHDGLVTYLSSGTVSSGLQAYTITTRNVTKLSIRDAADLLSCVSNELARRALPNRNELIDVVFDDDGAELGPTSGRPRGY